MKDQSVGGELRGLLYIIKRTGRRNSSYLPKKVKLPISPEVRSDFEWVSAGMRGSVVGQNFGSKKSGVAEESSFSR